MIQRVSEVILGIEKHISWREAATPLAQLRFRPHCVGNGETCHRSTNDGVKTLPCPSPDHSSLAKSRHCKPYGRLNIKI